MVVNIEEGNPLLKQQEAENLIRMKKIIEYGKEFSLPEKGKTLIINAKSVDEKEKFLFDIQRGKIDFKKCTYQNRYEKSYILLRLDIVSDKNFHINPDGKKIFGSHLHKYVEGFGDAWAESFITKKENKDLYDYLFYFFRYCNIINIPHIQKGWI